MLINCYIYLFYIKYNLYILIELGFLQINHRYEVTFAIKDKLHEDLLADPLQNLHLKALSIMPTEDDKFSFPYTMYLLNHIELYQILIGLHVSTSKVLVQKFG